MNRRHAPGRVNSNLWMLGAGQIDAGLASLAGFIAAAFAVRYLSPETLGVYSLLFLAFGVASQVPTQLVLSPSEVAAAHAPVELRIGTLRWSLPVGLLVSAAASVTVAAGVLPLADEVAPGSVTPLIATAVTFTLISPVQDHIRRILHAANRSGQAALISVVNLVLTAGTALPLLAIDPLLVPFGSMTIGNVVSCCVVTFFVKGSKASPRTPTRQLLNIGRYLLVVGLANSGGRYLAGTLVGTIAGSATLGFVEAARVVARPAEVFAMGTLAAVGPRLMAASAGRDRASVRRLSRTYYRAVLAVGGVYTLLVASPIALSLPQEAFPTAYEVTGLVLTMLMAQLVIAMTRPLQARLMGLREERSLAVIEVISQVGRLVGSASALWVGPFAVPIGDSASHAYKLARYETIARRRAPSQETDGRDSLKP